MKSVRLRRSFYVLLGNLPSVLVSSKMIHVLVKKYSSALVNSYLEIGIGIILVVTAVIIIFQIFSVDDERRNNMIDESRNLPIPVHKKVLAVLGGFLIGLLIGTTSIGGGVLIVPLFMLFLDASCLQVVGSSIFISLLLSAMGSIVYLYYGHIVISSTAILCVASIPGVILGSHFSKKFSESPLVIIVVALLILGGTMMFL